MQVIVVSVPAQEAITLDNVTCGWTRSCTTG